MLKFVNSKILFFIIITIIIIILITPSGSLFGSTYPIYTFINNSGKWLNLIVNCGVKTSVNLKAQTMKTMTTDIAKNTCTIYNSINPYYSIELPNNDSLRSNVLMSIDLLGNYEITPPSNFVFYTFINNSEQRIYFKFLNYTFVVAPYKTKLMGFTKKSACDITSQFMEYIKIDSTETQNKLITLSSDFKITSINGPFINDIITYYIITNNTVNSRLITFYPYSILSWLQVNIEPNQTITIANRNLDGPYDLIMNGEKDFYKVWLPVAKNNINQIFIKYNSNETFSFS